MNKYIVARRQLAIDAYNIKHTKDRLKRDKLIDSMQKLTGMLYFVRQQTEKYTAEEIQNKKNMLTQDISMFNIMGAKPPQSMLDAVELCDACLELRPYMSVH